MRILYIDVDSLSASHLACYGYHRDTSPAIDAVARDGVRFEQVYCSDAPCLPSRTALYSGRFGIQTGVVGHGGTAAQPKVEGPTRGFRDLFDQAGLARQLQSRGLHTAMISPFGQRHSAHWIYAGFNEIHNTGKCGLETAEDVQPVVEDWLRRHGASRESWFLHVNYWDAHTPYRVPMSYRNPFERQPLAPWLTQTVLDGHVLRCGPHSARDLGMYCGAANERYPRVPDEITDLATLRQWIDAYDVGIRYVDDQVARLVELLRREKLYDDTAIIISADHGENQGEMGIYGEHGTADVGTCRVPLVVKWPGGRRGAFDAALHYHLDLAPTLCELLDAPPPTSWDGQSFAPAIVERKAESTEAPRRGELVIGQCAHVCQRSVRFDRWLYVRTYHDGFQPFPDEMLFDLVADPKEQHDIAAQRADVCRDAAYRLQRWHDSQMWKMARTASDAVDPMWTVIKEGGPYHAPHDPTRCPLPAYLKRLEATGRSEGAARLRKKYNVQTSGL